MKKIIKTLSICLLAVMLFAFATGCIPTNNDNPYWSDLPSSSTQAQLVKFNGKETKPEQTLSRVEAINKVKRAVVAVEMQENGTAISRGSAVIVSVDSGKTIDDENVYYILTCHHVISSTGDIVIHVPDDDGRNYGDSLYDDSYTFKGSIGGKMDSSIPLTLVGGDKESDVAVLRLDVNGRKNKNGDPVSIVAVEAVTNSDYSVGLGEDVFAIGNPSGLLPGTVTVGTISYLERDIYLSEVGYLICYQIDTDIYHGSSGGALFNMYGQLIGITNAGSDEYSGINYAIPYKLNGEEDRGFISIATQLIGTATTTNYGYVSGRWNVGVVVNTTGTNGIEVISIEKNSNSTGKLQEGDVIVQVSYRANGKTKVQTVKTISDFSGAINDMKKYLKLGDSFNITVNRPNMFGSEQITVEIELKNQYIFCNTNS